MSTELASVLACAIASLVRAVDSSSPEEAGQALEEGMNSLRNLKADTPTTRALVDLGTFGSKLASNFKSATKALHDKCATPEAHKLYHEFISDPSIFIASIPVNYRYDGMVTRELAQAYELRTRILGGTSPSEKLFGMLTSCESLTLLLFAIKEMWENTNTRGDETIPPLEPSI